MPATVYELAGTDACTGATMTGSCAHLVVSGDGFLQLSGSLATAGRLPGSSVIPKKEHMHFFLITIFEMGVRLYGVTLFVV